MSSLQDGWRVGVQRRFRFWFTGAFAVAVAVAVALALDIGVLAQTNMSPYVGHGVATAIKTQQLTPGALPYISVVGAKTICFEFNLLGTIDSTLIRLEAASDTTKGWTILDGALQYTKYTAAGHYAYYTDTADAFRYFRMFYISSTDTSARINYVTCKVGWSTVK
jgi:hypothetical protein